MGGLKEYEAFHSFNGVHSSKPEFGKPLYDFCSPPIPQL